MYSQIDFTGAFKVLVILTSAFFAVAQYYENRQANYIKDELKTLKAFKFESFISNEGIHEVKKKWENILFEQPINNEIIIIILLALLVSHNILFAAVMVAGWCPQNIGDTIYSFVFWILRVLSIILIPLGILLVINCKKMSAQKKKFMSDTENFITLYDIVQKAINRPNKREQSKPTSPGAKSK